LKYSLYPIAIRSTYTCDAVENPEILVKSVEVVIPSHLDLPAVVLVLNEKRDG